MFFGCRCIFVALAVAAATGRASLAQEIIFPPNVISAQRNIPDSVFYGVLFRQAAAFYDAAAALDQAGKDGSPYRKHLAHKFNLSPTEVMALDEAGLLYNLRVKPIDDEIAASVTHWRAGLGAAPARAFPALPPEAAGLLAKRSAAIDNVRDTFHASIGDSEFARVDSLLKVRRAANGELLKAYQGGTPR